MAVYIEREAAIDIIEQLEWYHIRNGRLCNGAPNEESGLYKAVDIYEALYKVPANDTDVVKVVRCQDCIHSEPFERNCELNTTAYMHCALDRGETVKNVWHKYKKYYRDYSVVDRDGFCDSGERRGEDGNKNNM